MTDAQKAAVKELKHGESYYIDLGCDAGAEVWKLHEYWMLFEVPYENSPSFSSTYTKWHLSDMYAEIERWA